MVETDSTQDRVGAVTVPQHQAADLGFAAFRVALGGFFLYHGVWHFDKGMDFFTGLMHLVNVPAPSFAAHAVAAFEVVAGTCLVVGVGTRVLSAIGIAMMLVTGFYVKIHGLHRGFLGPSGSGGAETDFLYLLCFLVLVISGAGFYSVDRVLQTDKRLTNLVR